MAAGRGVAGDADWIGGLHAVEAVLREDPARVECLWLVHGRQDPRLRQVEELARTARCAVERVARSALDQVVGGAHQGVAARCRGAGTLLDEIGLSDRVAAVPEPLLLVLDEVQDPRNYGACLRSADGAGVDAVVVPRRRSAPLSAAARKTASGAAERVPIAQVTNLARTLRALQSDGVRIIGAAGDAPATLWDVDLTGPLALVLGGEEGGMRRLTREHCDELVAIPMAGSVSSLNVSVACAVLLYEAVRQRRLPRR